MKRILQHPLLASFGDIVANASALVGTTAVTALLGFVYWWAAARLFAPEEVGFAAASISATQLLGALGVFGCGTVLIGELQRRRDRGQRVALIVTTLAATSLLGVALGTGFALIAPHVAGDLRPLAANPANVGLFALGVGLTAATLLLDQAVLGLQRGGLQLRRNAIFAVIKLLALVPAGLLLARTFALDIYATWAAGLAVSLLWVAGHALRRGLRPRDCLPRWGLLHGLGKSALEHHFLNLALQAPGLVMPMIVTATLSTVQNAYFYTAWMVVGFVYVPPIALSIALFAAAASDPEAVARRLRFTLTSAIALGLAANLVLVVGARPILGLFGRDYGTSAGALLQIIGLAVFPLIVKDHYVALCRINGRVLAAAPPIFVGCLLELAAGFAGARLGGLTGLAVGWLLATCLEAAVMLPAIIRAATPARRQRGTYPWAREPRIATPLPQQPTLGPEIIGQSLICRTL